MVNTSVERQTCRTANDAASIRQSFLESLYFVQARFPEVATGNDYYLALAWTVRDRLLRRWVDTAATYYRHASHKINGVAELHSRLLRERVLKDFYELDPSRFTNVTNGVTPRRFLALANPDLARLLTETIGDGWLRDLERLRELETWAGNSDFQAAELLHVRDYRGRGDHYASRWLPTAGLL